MKLTTAVATPIDSPVERGMASVWALIRAEASQRKDMASRPNRAVNLVSERSALDARLDAIRRAGL